jgi:hypothetical protein
VLYFHVQQEVVGLKFNPKPKPTKFTTTLLPILTYFNYVSY